MESIMQSPAVAFVGRHNSGKTTLITKVIAELTRRGFDVGSVKHHGHKGFEIDIPGKDSWRHRHAGATETFIASPDMAADIKTLDQELECSEIVKKMPGHDVVLVEGYRKSGLPTIEIMRAENPADVAVARAFVREVESGTAMMSDAVQEAHFADQQEGRGLDSTSDRNSGSNAKAQKDIRETSPDAKTVAIVTDIPEAAHAAESCGIKTFGINDVRDIASFVQKYYCRRHLTVAIQAGGESKRMGTDKALVPFGGKPLIQRLVDRLLPVADNFEITSNNPDKLAFIQDLYPNINIGIHRDLLTTRGALEGLYTAFSYASDPYVAVVACDMINASPHLIAAEFKEIDTYHYDIVIPSNKHGVEPFHAVYARNACLRATKAALDRGEHRAQALLDSVSVRKFTQKEVLEAEPMGGCFINVNTPDELHKYEQMYFAE